MKDTLWMTNNNSINISNGINSGEVHSLPTILKLKTFS